MIEILGLIADKFSSWMHLGFVHLLLHQSVSLSVYRKPNLAGCLAPWKCERVQYS